MYPSFFHFRNNTTVNSIASFQYLNWVGCDTSYLLILILRACLSIGSVAIYVFFFYCVQFLHHIHQFPQVCVHLYLSWSFLLSQTISNHIVWFISFSTTRSIFFCLIAYLIRIFCLLCFLSINTSVGIIPRIGYGICCCIIPHFNMLYLFCQLSGMDFGCGNSSRR